jgi:hypothetical protein
LGGELCDFEALCEERVTNDHGINAFCEALKVDVAKSDESDIQDSVSRTLSLIKVMLEDMGVAMEIHDTAMQKTSAKRQLTPSMLFNSGYKFEEELLMAEEPTALEIESLKSFEAFCMFGHREFSQNLLRVMTRFI